MDDKIKIELKNKIIDSFFATPQLRALLLVCVHIDENEVKTIICIDDKGKLSHISYEDLITSKLVMYNYIVYNYVKNKTIEDKDIKNSGTFYQVSHEDLLKDTYNLNVNKNIVDELIEELNIKKYE